MTDCEALTQFSLHFLAASHFVDKLALESVDAWVQLRTSQTARACYTKVLHG